MNPAGVPSIVRRAGQALVAGALALIPNFALLAVADALDIVTARGGFQRLVKLWTGPHFEVLGIAAWWRATPLPDPNGPAFTVGFKIAVGLGMALVYAIIEPRLPGRPLVKGFVYAGIVWLLNAALVLPLLGEGVAGIRNLTPVGIVAFAVAHTAFFLTLAFLYAALPQSQPFPNQSNNRPRQ